jgi:NADPH:quinone reductase
MQASTITMDPDATVRGYVLSAHGAPEVLELVERELPVPAGDEVLIDVEVAGVNFGDTMIRRGEYLRDQPLSMSPGAEVVGRVIAGNGIEPGTRVAAWLEAGGGYASRVVAPAHRAYPVPENLPAATVAALFLQGVTAHYALHRFGGLRAGDWVLVNAASGGLGGLAVQLAKAAGADVVGAASSASKRAVAARHGADVVVDSSAPERLSATVRDATGGGVDVVVDGVGGALFTPSLQALAVNGRYVVVGSASQQPAMMDARRLLVRNQSVCGFILAHIAAAAPEEPRRTLLALCELAREGVLRPAYELAPLEAAPDVHRRIEDRSLTGKVVLEVAH